MKVGLLIQRFPGGGAERYVEEIAKRLHQKGEDVVVVTSDNDSDDSKYDFRVIRLPSLVHLGEYNIWKGLEKILEQEKFDVVHTNTYGYYHSDKAARLKKKYGYKLVMTSHGFTGMDLHKLKKEKIISKSSTFDFLREIYDKNIGIKTLLLCDHLIALSQYDYAFYKEIGVDESKISIIPPGVSDMFFEDVPKIDLKGSPVLLSVGQLSWIKNQKMMIHAMPGLLKQKPDAHLYLIGSDGGELTNLKKLCNVLNVEDNVSFLGTKNAREVCSYMKSSDLLLQTSYAEGLSTVLLEAAVSGLPFVTTNAGGNGTLAQENCIVEFDEYGNFLKIIENLLSKKEKTESAKIDEKMHSEFSWDGIFNRIITVYQGLTS